MTPDIRNTSKLDADTKPMTTLEFTKTNFKFGNLEELKKIGSKTSTNFYKPQVYLSQSDLY